MDSRGGNVCLTCVVEGSKVVRSKLANSCTSCLSFSCRLLVIPLSVDELVVGEVVVCNSRMSFCSSSLSCVIICSDVVSRDVVGLGDVTKETGRNVVVRVDDDGCIVVELLLNADVTGGVIIEVNKDEASVAADLVV